MKKQNNPNNKSAEEPAIKVTGVFKDFDLPHEKQNNLKYKILHPLEARSTVEKLNALKDISFEVKKGEFFGIVGRNGSGKSTLLKILAEIYSPTNGQVSIDGSLTPFIELGVGFNAELTGRENVYLNGAMLGFNTKEMKKVYQDIVDFAELEKFMDQKLKNYSSGMQVRLAFSVAIRAKSDILLLDEVLAVGDADFQRKCFNYFRTLKRNGKTVVLVTHDMNAVREYCDRAMLIEKSRVMLIGDNEKVSEEYTKLFQKEEASEGVSTTKNRRGNRELEVQKPKVFLSKDSIKVEVPIRARADVKDPVFGFKIKNSAGQGIVGTNNRIKKQRIESITKGTTLHCSWEFENLLNPGDYFLDTAVLSNDNLSPYDIWNEAYSFRVNKEESTPYPVTPSIKLKTKLAK